ncbi:hypothetical protein HYW17_03115 [Candidatus Uhrbacteria bacterium]|nr:hypothetical protein [Candidatus Uhrbacteria bacterium]
MSIRTVLFSIMLALGCGTISHPQTPHPQTGVYHATLGSNADHPICEAALRQFVVPGEVTFVHFWASWCTACAVVSEHIQQRFADQIRIVYLDLGDPRNASEDIMQLCGHKGLPIDIVYSRTGRMILNASPYKIVRNRSIVQSYDPQQPEGIIEYITFLDAVVTKLLKLPPSPHRLK